MVVWSVHGQIVVPGVQCAMGRKLTSYILVPRDENTVSRTHAFFTLGAGDGVLRITAASSSRTCLNGVLLVKGTPAELKAGDVVTLGKHKTEFVVACEELAVCTSRITETKDIAAVVKQVGGRMVNDPGQCTHLVVEDLTRTEKVYNALMGGLPIVSQLWVQHLLVPEKRKAWSSTQDYYPPPPKSARNEVVNPSRTTRKEFFAGKRVVFLLRSDSSKEKEKLKAAKTLAVMFSRIGVESEVAYVSHPDDFWTKLRDFLVVEYLGDEDVRDTVLARLSALGFASPHFCNQDELLDIISTAEVHRLRVMTEAKRIPPSSQQLLENSQKSQSQNLSQNYNSSSQLSGMVDLTGVGVHQPASVQDEDDDDDDGWGELKSKPAVIVKAKPVTAAAGLVGLATRNEAARVDSQGTSSSSPNQALKKLSEEVAKKGPQLHRLLNSENKQAVLAPILTESVDWSAVGLVKAMGSLVKQDCPIHDAISIIGKCNEAGKEGKSTWNEAMDSFSNRSVTTMNTASFALLSAFENLINEKFTSMNNTFEFSEEGVTALLASDEYVSGEAARASNVAMLKKLSEEVAKKGPQLHRLLNSENTQAVLALILTESVDWNAAGLVRAMGSLVEQDCPIHDAKNIIRNCNEAGKAGKSTWNEAMDSFSNRSVTTMNTASFALLSAFENLINEKFTSMNNTFELSEEGVTALLASDEYESGEAARASNVAMLKKLSEEVKFVRTLESDTNVIVRLASLLGMKKWRTMELGDRIFLHAKVHDDDDGGWSKLKNWGSDYIVSVLGCILQ
jgi:hypothetical protein